MQEYPSASVIDDWAAKPLVQISRKRIIQAVMMRNRNIEPPSNAIGQNQDLRVV
jgi:hypothetical protein